MVKNDTGDRLNFGLAAQIARPEGNPRRDDRCARRRCLEPKRIHHRTAWSCGLSLHSQNRGSCCFCWFLRLRSDRALSTNSRPAIATARHFGDPESPINVLGARYQNPNFYVSSEKRRSLSSIRCVAITTRRRTAVAIRHRGNSQMPSSQ